jgi:peptidoglycan/LPS O-acetylase OafA/YrhL
LENLLARVRAFRTFRALASAKDRSVVLDVLRAVAVLLVLGRHLQPCPPEQSTFLNAATTTWARGGWMGVDLFFVLSGFLVSGLLFKEHQLHGEMRLKRFFFRRGLKIYPAFLAFLFVATAWRHLTGAQIGPKRFLVELLFLQNYFPSIWFHTWSLAVEEHFYLLLPVALLPLLRKRGEDPVPTLCLIFLGVAGICLSFRLFDSTVTYDFYRHTAPTHKRIDSLFAGVMLSALYHYRREKLERFATKYGILLVPLGIALMAIPFVFALDSTRWIHGIGYTLLYLGGVMVLAVAVTRQDLKHWFWQGWAKIGMDSYSIYLWHAAALMLVAEPLRRIIPQAGNWYFYAMIYIGSSLALGMTMSKLVEWPILRIRDRYFPSRSNALDKVDGAVAGPVRSSTASQVCA